MRFLLFILLLNLLLVALNVRAYRWLNQAFELSRAHRRALIGIMAASLIVSGVGRMLSRAGYELPFEWPLVLAFAIQLTMVISVILLFVLDVARLLRRASNSINAALRKRRKQPMLEQAAGAPSTSNVERPASMGSEALTLERSHLPPAMAAENPVELRGMHAQTASGAGQPNSPLSRRDFALKLAVGSTFLVGGTSSAYGALIGRHDYVIEEVPVRIPGLRKAFTVSVSCSCPTCTSASSWESPNSPQLQIWCDRRSPI